LEGQNVTTLGLTGQEVFDISGLSDHIQPRSEVTVTAVSPDGARRSFQAIARLDSAVEVNYYRNGGILPAVLRSLLT
jgi:aconitate hydratase